MFALVRNVFKPALIRNSPIFGEITKLNYSDDEELSERELRALYKSLCLINDNPECYGKSFFSHLFKKYPDYTKFFKKYGDCPDDILANKKFIKSHVVGNVFKALGDSIKMIEDPCEAEREMKNIGKLHKTYCMKPQHFKNARKVLLSSLEYNLAVKWDSEVEEGWKKATKIMFRGLQNGLKADDDDDDD